MSRDLRALTFSKTAAEQILRNETDTRTLLSEYPEYKEEVLLEINALSSQKRAKLIQHLLASYTSSAKIAKSKIVKSGFNQTTINAFLPNIIKARFAIYLIEQLQLTVSTESVSGPVRFNLWDGYILQAPVQGKACTEARIAPSVPGMLEADYPPQNADAACQ